jgi:ribulose-phosphate 3-epimerase
MSTKIIPAILSGSIEEIQRQVDLVKQIPEFEAVQIDIVDAIFADNHTVSPQDLLAVDFGKLKIDFHLMTEEPMDYVWEMEEHAKQLPIRAVYGQVEKMSYQEAFLEEVKKQDWKAGLALNLYTPVEEITDDAWDWSDSILLMAVEAGEQGQSFNSLVFEKIKLMQEKMNQNAEPVKISVDGGIKLENLDQLLAAKVDELAIGSALFADESNFLFNAKEILNKQELTEKED